MIHSISISNKRIFPPQGSLHSLMLLGFNEFGIHFIRIFILYLYFIYLISTTLSSHRLNIN
jgi:hypothetical protein